MTDLPEGNAIVYCEGAFNTPNGKTAHGLVRFTKRYCVLSVIDSRYAGEDAGDILDGQIRRIPVYADIAHAVAQAKYYRQRPTHLVVGLAPDGGKLNPKARKDVMRGIRLGLNVDCGLHDFLTEDEEIVRLTEECGVVLRDIRKPLPRERLHFFSGKIEKVDSLKVALLGTDSAVGKRTTAWILVHALEKAGYSTEMIGTGQTAWMQGVRYGLILDSLINDFVSGEIEHAVYSAWKEQNPDVIVIEGQGSLMNPAYPGGFEIMAAGRPDIVVLQHAPARKEYDGFPGYPIQPLPHQIKAVEVLSDRKVVAVTVNHEGMTPAQVKGAIHRISEQTGLPAFDVLADGAAGLVEVLVPYMKRERVAV